MNLTVDGSRGQSLSVCGLDEVGNPGSVTSIHTQVALRVRIPDSDFGIHGSRGQVAAIRRPRETVDVTPMSWEFHSYVGRWFCCSSHNDSIRLLLIPLSLSCSLVDQGPHIDTK